MSHNQQWSKGNNEGRGYSVGGENDDINGLAGEIGGELIHPSQGDWDCAVYRVPSGSLVLVGDSCGPWAVTAECEA